MQDLAQFFLQVSERVNANGGVIPQELLHALSTAPVPKKKPATRKIEKDPIDILADRLIRKYLFGDKEPLLTHQTNDIQ